ncbi:MAG: nucleoside monophosphate kinase [Candidatus Pacebacteria bacterium]|jgi:adenylate kinase|nr:nucleoside monophosphate kinase [Candidatus Paceibacterota bacterium]
MTQNIIIFIGRYGSGKGTQAKFLIEDLKKADTDRNVLYIETGAEFRKFMAKKGNHTADMTKKVVDVGGLLPEFMPIHIWSSLLVDNYTGSEHIVFDGTPRKLLEAQILDPVFSFYGMAKPKVLFLSVSHEVSLHRLALRAAQSGRADDSREAIEKRKKAFEADVDPVIEWYRTNPNIEFVEIDGDRTEEEIHADIVKKVGLV